MNTSSQTVIPIQSLILGRDKWFSLVNLSEWMANLICPKAFSLSAFRAIGVRYRLDFEHAQRLTHSSLVLGTAWSDGQ